MVVDGMVDQDAPAKLARSYQDEAAQQSGVVTLYIQNNAGHDAASGVTEETRAREFAKFLAGAR